MSQLNFWSDFKKIQSQRSLLLYDLFDRYRFLIVPQKSTRTQKDNLVHLKRLDDYFGHFRISEITQAHGVFYLNHRKNSSPTQARQEFSLLRHVFSMAVQWGIIDTNPLFGTPVNKILRIAYRDRVPSVDELISVKLFSDIRIQLFIDFKYQVGLSQGDIFALPVPDLQSSGIFIERGKTRVRGVILWTPELKTTVQALIDYNAGRCPLLFCNTLGNPVRVDTFSQSFKRAVNATISAGKLKRSFTPNDIRSSYATDSEEIYGLDATRQLLHSSASTKFHYVHLRNGIQVNPIPPPK